VFDHPQGAALLDLDDFDLPDPETEEDASEEPTAMASTAELLAAVAARVQANQSIGHVVLDAPQDLAPQDRVVEAPVHDNTEPTLAHQPVAPLPEADLAPAVQVPTTDEAGGSVGALLLAMMLVSAVIGLAAFLATQVGT